MTKKHKLSARGQRRASERSAVSLAKDRVRLAELSPGGSPDRPIVVETTSVIDGRARDTPCAVCEGQLTLEEHEVVAHAGVNLRRTRGICRECHTPRILWFRLEPPRPN